MAQNDDVSSSLEVERAGLPANGRRSSEDAVPWASLLGLFAGHFAVDCCTGIWPVFKTLAGLDVARAGLIATVGAMTGHALQLVFGPMADRGARKTLLVIGVLLAGCVTWVTWTDSLGVMFVLVLGTYVGSAAYHPAGTGVAGALSMRRTGVLVGIFLAGGYLGYSLSQVLFSRLFRAAPRLTPLLHLLPIAAAIAITLHVPHTAGRVRTRRWPVREIVAHGRQLGALFAVQVLTTAINAALIFLLPDLLLARNAPAWMIQGGGHFALVAGGCLSLLPGGHASDRFGARRVLFVANLSTGVLLTILLARHSATWVDLVVVSAFGALNGVNNVVTVSEGNRTMPGWGSAASALLMGLPWCFAATTYAVAGALADPAKGGTPVRALCFISITIPLALVASRFLSSHPRQTTAG